jgi:hypothetical protein
MSDPSSAPVWESADVTAGLASPEAIEPPLDQPHTPPLSGIGGEGQDRLADDQSDLMRGWLGDIQPQSRRSLRKNAHVTRLSG